MRDLGNIAARIGGIIALMMIVNISNATDIELRFQTERFDNKSKELYVAIQVNYINSGQFNLAGQNYRFYYDSEVLKLDTDDSKSKLSGSSYTAIAFENHFHGVEADDVNQLVFDDNLGFANFSIDLTDNANGGLSITEDDKWVTVAILKFKVLKADSRYDIVWGRPTMSDKYATAFVEMAQWKSPTKRDRVTISYYGDLTFEPTATTAKEEITIQVGPNPAIDFVQVTFGKELRNSTDIYIINTAGQKVASAKAFSGSITTQIEVAGLPGGAYLIEMVDEAAGTVNTKPIMIAK